ncbi:MAG: aspartate kinase [Saprospiraceae bacterium]|uniref:Aspartokinase n=1 Tax=Candidatus Opimibacter skivensis TaxID=2982028 RepID=A0A9D7XS11_9BACT|nr:aspartate kinase [Candidatus Opimibacter skivensis]
MNRIEVYKFGGASVKDAEAIKNVGLILQSTPQRPLVVVISAMGKTTNALEAIIKAHYNDPANLPTLVDQLKVYHEDVARSLLHGQEQSLLNDLHDLWVELNWILEDDPHPNYNYHYDQIIVFGELASTKIVSAYLEMQKIDHQWLDARSFIKTDSEFREARIQWEQTQSAIDTFVRDALHNEGMVITQGFIGSTPYNESTTLGREGSDYTAAVLAYALDASSVTIWKDVPGIMTADPKRFDKVARLEEISYNEAIEMTYYGAKVIHPKTIKPLQNKDIPLFVRPFDQPSLFGTKISSTETHFLPPIIVVEPEQVLLQISTRDFSFVAEEHLSEIFNHISRHRIKVNMMRNTAVSFIICVKNETDKLDKLKNDLEQSFHITMEVGLDLITVRHANQGVMDQLRRGKEIILEEKFGDTDRMIVKEWK